MDIEKRTDCLKTEIKSWSEVASGIRTAQGVCFQGHSNVVATVAWTPPYVLTGCYDGFSKIWDSKTGEVLYTLENRDSAITSVDIGSRYAFTAQGGNFRKYDIKNGALIREYDVPIEHELKMLKLSPDESKIAVGELINDKIDAKVLVYDLVTDSLVSDWIVKSPKVWRAHWFDEESIAIACSGGKCFVYHNVLKEPNLIHDISEGVKETYDVTTWISERNILFTAGKDGKARQWNLESGPEIVMLYEAHEKDIRALCVEDSRTFLFTGSPDTTVCQFDIKSGLALRRFKHVEGIRAIVTGDRNRIISAGMSGTAYLWDYNFDATQLQQRISERFEVPEEVVSTVQKLKSQSRFMFWLKCFVTIWPFIEFLIFIFRSSANGENDAQDNYKWAQNLTDIIFIDTGISLPEFTFCSVISVTLFAVLSICFNVYEQMTDHLARINSEGRGIKQHMERGPQFGGKYGLIIDSKSRLYTFMTYATLAFRFFHLVISTIFFVSIVRILLATFIVSFDIRDISSENLVESEVLGVVGLCVLLLYLPYAAFMGLSDGNVTEVPRIPLLRAPWNPFTVLYYRLTINDYQPAFFGIFTQETNHRIYRVTYGILVKFLLTLFNIVSVDRDFLIVVNLIIQLGWVCMFLSIKVYANEAMQYLHLFGFSILACLAAFNMIGVFAPVSDIFNAVGNIISILLIIALFTLFSRCDTKDREDRIGGSELTSNM